MSPKPTPGAIPKVVKKKHTFRVFGFIATSMILLSLVSVAGVYAYKEISLSQLTSAKEALNAVSSAQVANDIHELEVFHNKVSAAEYLIENHLSPSKLLEALEASTKQTIQFTTFTYTYDPGFQALLEMSGGTSDFMSVAVQNIEFLADSIYTEHVIDQISSTVSAEQDTQEIADYPVTFTVRGDVDKSLFAYTGGPVVPQNDFSNLVPTDIEEVVVDEENTDVVDEGAEISDSEVIE
jgi:hypothetical protein